MGAGAMLPPCHSREFPLGKLFPLLPLAVSNKADFSWQPDLEENPLQPQHWG